MTRLDNSLNEELAVDAISSDIALLERLAAGGGTLCGSDMELLAQYNERLLRLMSVFSANSSAAGTAAASGTEVARPQDGRRPSSRSPMEPA